MFRALSAQTLCIYTKWCGMQCTAVWSLMHDLSTSFGLNPTLYYLYTHPQHKKELNHVVYICDLVAVWCDLWGWGNTNMTLTASFGADPFPNIISISNTAQVHHVMCKKCKGGHIHDHPQLMKQVLKHFVYIWSSCGMASEEQQRLHLLNLPQRSSIQSPI